MVTNRDQYRVTVVACFLALKPASHREFINGVSVNAHVLDLDRQFDECANEKEPCQKRRRRWPLPTKDVVRAGCPDLDERASPSIIRHTVDDWNRIVLAQWQILRRKCPVQFQDNLLLYKSNRPDFGVFWVTREPPVTGEVKVTVQGEVVNLLLEAQSFDHFIPFDELDQAQQALLGCEVDRLIDKLVQNCE
jgi:hypothetical protein